MGDRIDVSYFLEDRAQELFLLALVDRIARDLGIRQAQLDHNVQAARHGSQVLKELKEYGRDFEKNRKSLPSVLVVAIDGNCKGIEEGKRQIQSRLSKSQALLERTVMAIPDPHIERWYILDQKALKDAVGMSKGIQAPGYKCQKDYYKKILKEGIEANGTVALLGGPQYGRDIVRRIDDIDAIAKLDRSLQSFVTDLRAALKQLA